MKVKVKEVFRDKYSGKVYKLNELLDVSEERYQEINRDRERVEIVKEEKANTKASAKTDENK